jgi:hypothetical protein
MPRKPKAPVSSPAGAILQLKIRLLAISPMIWRRVLVPAAFTLRQLHGVIQVAMGWESLHLYLFQIRAVAYGSFQLSVESPDATMESFRFRKNAKFAYLYDMSAGWEHEIWVEVWRDNLDEVAATIWMAIWCRGWLMIDVWMARRKAYF